MRADIDNTVSSEFLRLARNTAAELAGDRAAVPYNPEWQLREHEFFGLEHDEVPAPTFFAALVDLVNVERFKRRMLRKPRLYTVVVQSDSGTALFGKRMAYLKVLGKSRGSFSAVWDGSSFNKLDESVATFAKNFDWVFWQDCLYVLDARNFHAEFRDSDAIREAVREHVAQIQEHIEIVGSDELIARCQASVPMASKLKRVAESGIYAEPIDVLKGYASRYNLPVVWDEEAVVFDGTIEAQWAILKLLDEDRTEGPVSGRQFESSSKRDVTAT